MPNSRYHEPYRKLTNDLTNMYASERRALDVSPDYEMIMEFMVQGLEEEAVNLSLKFQDQRGDEWRACAAECGLIDSPAFVRSVNV